MTTRTIWTPNAGAQQMAWERMDVKQLFFGGGRGCVHPDTLLDTPNGKVKISEWEGGDIYSFKDGKIITTYATKSIRGTKEHLYDVALGWGNSVTCTDQHKFFSDGKWKELQDLHIGDWVLIAPSMNAGLFGAYSQIKSVRKRWIKRFYWDLHVPETNCYFAQGILHHNSGKTSWIIGVALTQWAMYGASARCLILRRQFRDLREIIRQAKEILCDNGLATYNASEHVFYGKGRFKGATLELGNLERLDDYSRYHGNAYSMVGFDEITEFGSWEMVDKMGSTCRSKDPRVTPIMRFTGNPGGRLHQEVKRRFYDPAPMGGKLLITKSKKLPDGTVVKGQTRMMVSSTVKDNPFLWENDPDYVTWLLSLPETLRKAWFEGCWDIAIGSFFGDVWDARKHVIRRVEPKDVPADWEIRRSFDWGSSTPFCLLWYTISNGDPLRDGRQIPRGAIIILWEFYGSDPSQGLNVGLKWSNIQQAQAFARKEIEMGIDGRVIAGPADNQIYANTNGTDSNLYINFEREGILFTKSNKSAGSTKIGLEQIRTRMVGRDGYPLLYFTEDCSNCIRTIPELARHGTKLHDIDDNQEDHCFVAGTMITMADGSHKSIETVEVGDMVKTLYGANVVLSSEKTRENAIVNRRIFEDGLSFVCTDNHPIMVFDYGFSDPTEVKVEDLRETDLVLSESGDLVYYRGVEVLGREDVFNLSVEKDHTYYADGVLVHNCGDVVKYIALHHTINVNQKGVGSDDLTKAAQKRLKS